MSKYFQATAGVQICVNPSSDDFSRDLFNENQYVLQATTCASGYNTDIPSHTPLGEKEHGIQIRDRQRGKMRVREEETEELPHSVRLKNDHKRATYRYTPA